MNIVFFKKLKPFSLYRFHYTEADFKNLFTGGAIIEHLSISPISPGYVVRGQNFSISCNATITKSDAYSVKWYRFEDNKYVYINVS